MKSTLALRGSNKKQGRTPSGFLYYALCVSRVTISPDSHVPLPSPPPRLPYFFIFQSEILREADAMANLDHPNIVRLFGEALWCPPPGPTGGNYNCLSVSPPAGICVRNPIMLVMEIASLGPLNKFLRRHPSVPIYTPCFV